MVFKSSNIFDDDPVPNVDVTKYVDGELVESYRHPKDTETGSSAGTNQNGASAYTFDNYQDDASTTAIYPDHGEGTPAAFAYLFLKLNGEAGEAGEAYAKYLRGDYEWDECKSRVERELGDVLWYASQISKEFKIKLSDIADANVYKLNDRKQRGVIRGSGDDR